MLRFYMLLGFSSIRRSFWEKLTFGLKRVAAGCPGHGVMRIEKGSRVAASGVRLFLDFAGEDKHRCGG